MTRTVDVRTPDASLSDLVSLAQSGTEVILTEGDKPLARLVPISPAKQRRTAGLNRGSISTSEDFDAPLPDEFWTGTP
jgi:antitoxin (DNA-binding transcriptional repressor) of toxin-antitoxin stability system